MSNGKDFLPGQQIKADLEVFEVMDLLKTHYGFKAKTIVELDAYDDRNYRVIIEADTLPDDNSHVTSISKEGYIFKVINSLDSKDTEFYEAQSELLVFLINRNMVCPVPVKMKNGSYFATVTLKSGVRHIIRLLVFQQGETLGKVGVSSTLFTNLGLYAGSLNVNLQEFSHPGYDNRTSAWVLEKVPKLRELIEYLKNNEQKELVEEIIKEFEENVLPIHDSLEKGIIHGDLNESNILVTDDHSNVAAIIDFGDSHRNCYVFELAICLCYMITKANSIAMANHVINGYQTIKQLTPKEQEILRLCVCARFAQSLTMGAYSSSMEPDNKYLTRDEAIKWNLLEELWKMRNSVVMELWGLKKKN